MLSPLLHVAVLSSHLALPVAPVATGAFLLAPLAPAQDDSIEALRRSLDAQLAAQVAEVRPKVEELLAELVAASGAHSARRAATARAALRELPPAAALVLVEELEQGERPNESQVRRMDEAGLALRTVSSAAILGRLEELTEHANDQTRRLAIGALGGVPNTIGAQRVLTDLHGRRAGEDRALVVGALVQQRLDEGFDALVAAVGRRDERAVQLGLEAAREIRWDDERFARLSQGIDAAIAEPAVARDAWAALLATVSHFEDLATPERVSALLEHVLSGRVRGADGAALVEGIGTLDIARRHVQGALDTLTRSSDPQVAQAALVALTRMGDKEAEDELLDPLEEKVDEAERSKASALLELGRVKIRIGEYADAINDLRKAVKEAKDAGAYVLREIHIALAEAYLRNERFDKAASALEDAALPEAQRIEMASLPLWKPLAEHFRYGEVLEP